MNKKAGYIGYQTKSWNDILKHEIFTQGVDEAEMDYPWVISNDERVKHNETKQRELAEETLNKLYHIYVSRSSSLFSPDHILLYYQHIYTL